MTGACTETSIAVVDSSAISMAGSHAIGEAIWIRCHGRSLPDMGMREYVAKSRWCPS